MFIWLQKNRIKRLKGRVWNLAFLSMEAILASFLWQHKSHDAWSYYTKTKPSATINDINKSPKDKVDKLNECRSQNGFDQGLLVEDPLEKQKTCVRVVMIASFL
jgi:hypothetical protein